MTELFSQDSMNDFPEIAPFDPTKKKKKKKHKNKVVIHHYTNDSLNSSVDRADMISSAEQARDDCPALMTNGGAGSTKSINAPNDFNIDAGEHQKEDHAAEDEEGHGAVQQSNYPWKGSEYDYQYIELLRRLFSFMHINTPEHAGDRQRTVLRPSEILSDGTAQTVFVNFVDLCKTMHRPPEHVKAYMLKEIGSFGSLDGEKRLIVKGRFAPTSFEDILQRYLNEYVLCNICRSPDTILTKEDQILLLQCEMCGSEQSVPPVDTGYITRVGRRKT